MEINPYFANTLEQGASHGSEESAEVAEDSESSV